MKSKNQALQECLYLLKFLKDVDDHNGRREMTYFQILNISKEVWQKWKKTFKEKIEGQNICCFSGSHSNILKALDRKCEY